MIRRNFIKLSAGAFAAAAVHNQFTFAAGNNLQLINLPDEAWADLPGGWVKLDGVGTLFTNKELQVEVKANLNGQAVFIQSPVASVKAIRLKWKYNTKDFKIVLGDHWERSYGDLAWKSPDPTTKNPWYLLLHDDEQTACFGVKTGASAFCWWAVKGDGLELTLDTLSGGMGVKLGQRKLHAADIVTGVSKTGETPFATATRFCRVMCANPRLPKQPVYGINDWYYAYGNNSPKLITAQTAIMAELATDTNNRPFSVIDAGWAAYSPLLPGDCCWQEDFSKPNEKFKDMHKMAAEITYLGMRPGLWTRPLCGKHNDSKALLAPVIAGRDDPKKPILDPTIPENIARIKHNIATYKQWGFEMVKHDFSTYDITGRWGFEMTDGITVQGWKFNDDSRTNAEIINNLYREIRASAGDMYLIGCNTVSHLSAGLFELNRTGDDTSGKEWERTKKMGVNTLGFRLPQHNTFYAADGDCIGLTKDVPWIKNRQWLDLLAQSGAPLFISGEPNYLGAEQKMAVKQGFAQAAKVQPTGEPLDWLTEQWPKEWKLNNKVVKFNWD